MNSARHRFFRRIGAGVLAAAAWGGVAVAPAAAESMFEAGTWALSLTGGYAVPITNDEEYYGSVAVAPAYYFADRLAVVPQLRGLFVDTEFSDTIGLDFTLSVRAHLYRGERWSFYVQAGPGLSYFDHRIPPPEGTRFNFVLTVGAGVTYRIAHATHLLLGLDVLHYSNGGIQGSDRHRGSNALSGVVGLLWTF